MRGIPGRISPWRLTPAVKALLVANLAVYVVQVVVTNWIDGPFWGSFFQEHFAVTPQAVFGIATDARGLHFRFPEVWQVATYMWLHSPSDPLHLLVNLLVLWMFGGLLEGTWGSRAFTRFYLLCGIGAGVVIAVVGLIVPGYETIATMGASGALFGMTVAFGLVFPDLQVLLMFMIPIRGKTLVLILIGAQILFLLARVPGISIVGHLSGAAMGWLLVTGYWRPRRIVQRLQRLKASLPTPPKSPKKKVDYLRVVPPEDQDDDERGSNGAGKYLH